MKLGIFSWFSYRLPIEERLRLIKRAGFDATSLWWGEEDKQVQPELARKLGLEIDNIHTPFNNANDLWLDKISGEEYLESLFSCVDDCSEHNIPVAVIHITGQKEPPEITETGIRRVKRLVEHAEKKDIRLAFENLNFLQHLDFIFNNINSDHTGFCYDSGHEHFYHPDADCLARYGDRLSAVHLDDNFGDHDTHLLPFDGTVNWDIVCEKLQKSRVLKYLTLEVDFNPEHRRSQIYKNYSAEEYLARAYERVQKLRSKMCSI